MQPTLEVEVYEDAGGEWRYRFVSSNGEKFGDGYTSKGDAIRGVRDLLEALTKQFVASVTANINLVVGVTE
jgi:uncharacterized protein YegP (UPF0339 family)